MLVIENTLGSPSIVVVFGFIIWPVHPVTYVVLGAVRREVRRFARL